MNQKGFDEWKSKHGKSYGNENHHENASLSFSGVQDFLTNHNQELLAGGSYLFKCSHNKFSDFSLSEFLKCFTGFDANQHEQDRDNDKNKRKFDIDVNGLPKCVDWRDEGYVNQIVNQGQCGCCYTFSACAAIEGKPGDFFLSY